jgi:AcrR family transcriptional regulator
VNITPKPDGRQARADDGRKRVGAALLALVSETGRIPDIESVAQHAGVSRRSVFRYFDGVGALELETARLMRTLVTERHPLPEARGNVKERVRTLIEHRASLYETITPIRKFLDAARYGGNADIDAFVDGARRLLKAHLKTMFARELIAHPERLSGLDLVTSWEGWRVLREGQRHSIKQAKVEMANVLHILLSP